jgi:spermidine synthase
LLPLGILLAFGSGAAALIYEVVWFQILELVVSSTAVSLGILLAAFMGGMCLGSWLFPRVFSSRHPPLRVYALIELGIGAFGIVELHLIPLCGSVYTAWSGYGVMGFMLRGLVAIACLALPTLLMGATLPALARVASGTTPARLVFRP